jgi:uncharacterized membrane protein YjgN (DUF898 family)
MKALRLLTGAFLVALILITFPLATTHASNVETFAVSGLSTTAIRLTLSNGTQVNGTISTNGNIRFFINNPHGEEIYDLGIVSVSVQFSFKATEDGNYSLNFQNGHLDTANVDFIFDYSGQTPNGTTSSVIPINVLVTVVSVVCLGIILGLATFQRHRSKKNLSQPENANFITGAWNFHS